jgi:hypothetical protein
MHRGVRPFPSFSRIYSAPSSSNADCMQSIRLYLTDEANQTFTHLLKAEISSYTSSSNAYPPSPPSSPNLSFLQSSIANVASSAGPSTPGRSRNPTSSSSGVHPSSPSTSTGSPFPTPTTPTRKRLFNYTSPAYTSPQRSPQRYAAGLDDPTHDAYSVSPVTYESQRLLLSPRKATRTIAKGPFKVLDAPDLADDYYLNLVDWSSTNVLGVGLASCVYLWSANTSRVTKLCDLTEGATTPAGAGNLGLPDAVTSLNWTGKVSSIPSLSPFPTLAHHLLLLLVLPFLREIRSPLAPTKEKSRSGMPNAARRSEP